MQRLVVGKDRENHIKTVDATSLFDAAKTAMMNWSRLWWWSSQRRQG